MIKNILIPRVTLPTRRPPSNSSRAASSNNSSSSRTYLPTESQVCQCRCRCQGRNSKCCRLFMPWQNREKRDNEECFLFSFFPFSVVLCFRFYSFFLLFPLVSLFGFSPQLLVARPVSSIFDILTQDKTVNNNFYAGLFFIYSITDYVFKKNIC